MAFQAVPEVAQIDVVFTQNGVTMQNSYYAKHPGGYSLANLQALADDIDTAIDAVMLIRLPDTCDYVRTDVRGLAVENDLVATQNANAGPGTDAADPLPNNVTFSIKKTSGLTGRAARGRTYWPAIPRDKVNSADQNLLDSTYAAVLVSVVGSIRTNIDSTGNWDPVLVSRWLNNVKRAVGVTFPWTGESSVNLVIDTQRGRLPK